ncbi:MAG: uracil-DNA glycosylase [Nitrospirae bacterium]|nr:uracil-DNA glycosylase [Nitrospirota bacterium]MBF0535962.1 uracil-DNA glycosylase [Nitrospirota bacterium]MBF0618062.1 uracil-DNA glycosylase [Nitrospirota bacterium]
MVEFLKVYEAIGFEFLPISGKDEIFSSQIEPDSVTEPIDNSNEVMTLQAIRHEIGNCKRCKLHKTRKNIVFGEGDAKARLMFIGEGPGADEDEQGRPFVGRAGKLLTSLINKMGLKREDVFIANVVKCRPPGNREPEQDEVKACIGFLKSQIASITPEVIVTLGTVATKAILATDRPITRLRGEFKDYKGIKLMPTYHPSYLLRNPSAKTVVWTDALKVLKELGLEAPAPAENAGA